MRSARRILRTLLCLTATGSIASFAAEPTAPTLSPQNIAAHIARLASDEFEGRAPGTRGEALTIDYLARQFRGAGALPGNPDGTWLQNVPMVGFSSVPRIRIATHGRAIPFEFLADFVHDTTALRPRSGAKDAGIVFVGFGIAAPAYDWDDYRDVDVRGKLVIALGGEPSLPDPAAFKGATRTYYSSRDSKFATAAARGAAGILIISDPEKSHTFSVFQTFAKMEGAALEPARAAKQMLISGLVTTGAARRLFAQAGVELDSLQAAAGQRGFRAVALDATADISITNRLRRFTSHNVVARIPGSDPALAQECVVYTAHWDHLGRDPNLAGDQIYNGAIDDAAGTAQLLEIARGFASLPQKPRRSILFVATTGEEKGYLGSRHYVRHPLFPLEKTVANINLDGGNVWGVTNDLIATGYGLSTLDETLAAAARLQGRTFIEEPIDDGALYFASDQIEFAKAGIPAAFPFSGSDYAGRPRDFGERTWEAYSTNDYHQVSDEVKPDWDYAGAAQDAQWLLIAGQLTADAEGRPRWKPGSEFERL